MTASPIPGKVIAVDPVTIALVTAGMGVLWWRHLRQAAPPQIAEVVDGDAEVALHVASHEAQTRGEPLGALHILYGLLQDEAIVAAARDAGADVAALEDAVTAALDDPTRRRDDDDDARRMLAHAHGHAHHAERRVSVVDLWAYLREAEVAAAIVDATPATVRAVLHRLCHGGGELAIASSGPDVHVVIRNDDYTTHQFVCELLIDVFALAPDDAATRTLAVHREGRGIVGRFRAADAHAKIADARARATAHGFPLWIATEPT